MMVGVLLYAYCVGERSSRQIEKRCMEDVAYRVVAANYQPDHATLARFRADFQKELGDLFFQILKLCQSAGLVKAGAVSLDGTKIKANAALDQNRTLEHLRIQAAKMLAEAAKTDASEDSLYGADKRGDELPEDLRDPRSRKQRLKECMKRLEEQAQAARTAQQALIDTRAKAEAAGQRFKGPKYLPAESKVKPNAKANLTDPESRIMKTRRGHRQCYNAQAVSTENQIVIAADVTQQENDYHQAIPMLTLAQTNLAAAQCVALSAALMDSGYWSVENAEAEQKLGVEIFMPTQREWQASPEEQCKADASGAPPPGAKIRERLERRLATTRGQEMYKKRSQTIEPVFGQIKTVQNGGKCSRRGLEAARQEWLLTCGAHNFLKLWRSKRAEKN
jgi:hypothetical protein